jgi:hypothetical protein
MSQGNGRGGVRTGSDKVFALVQEWGSIDQREAFRRLAPAMGPRHAASAIGLAILGGRVRLDGDGALRLADDPVQVLADVCLRGEEPPR